MNEIKIMNKNNYTLEIEAMEYFYIITFKDFHDDYKMYIGELVSHSNLTVSYLNIEPENNGSRTEIAIRNEDASWFSQYGEIDSVISLKDLIITYSEIKNEYSYDDINELVEKYSKDYLVFKEKDNVKKLELKK